MRRCVKHQAANIFMFVMGGLFLWGTVPGMAARQEDPYKVVDSSDYGYDYGYASCMVYDEGTYHMWYGSEDNVHGWDSIRYTSSADGVTWSAPTEVIICSNYDYEHCCCDPSVVYFEGYWYCYYSANNTQFNAAICPQTVHCVARASQPEGPFYKYTNRGTWEINPTDPKLILLPVNNTYNDYYGCGTAAVVVRNGRLFMWYLDDTTEYPVKMTEKILLSSTDDPVNWPAGQITSLTDHTTADVEWDEQAQCYILYEIDSQNAAGSYMRRFYSRDGMQWTGPYNIMRIPDYSGSACALRDKYGHTVLNGKNIISYGSPYDLSPLYVNSPPPPTGTGVPPYCWGFWEVYAHEWNDPVAVIGDFDGDGKNDPAMVDTINGKWYICSSATGEWGVPNVPWGWKWEGMTPKHRLACGDYDGDGITDLAIVDFDTAGGASWYIFNVATGEQGVSWIPWGWQWASSDARCTLVCADYDGDGKTDPAMVDLEATGGATWSVYSSLNGNSGTTEIPWGWQWTGISREHTLIMGDFDGDGKADRGVVDPQVAGGMSWYVIGSTSGLGTTDIPWGWQWTGIDDSYALALADYDGDGKTDRAVVGPEANSPWFVYSSQTGSAITDFAWGEPFTAMGPQHQVVPADYDGDGKADRAIVDSDLGSGAVWCALAGSVPLGWQIPMNYSSDAEEYVPVELSSFEVQ